LCLQGQLPGKLLVLVIYGSDVDTGLPDLVFVVIGLKEGPLQLNTGELVELGIIEVKAEALEADIIKSAQPGCEVGAVPFQVGLCYFLHAAQLVKLFAAGGKTDFR